MGNQTDYFVNKGYKPTYFIGDRVFGRYNNIPFIGSIGNDTMISEIEGPYITVHLDLPIKIDNEIKTFIIVKHKDIKLLKEIKE